MHGKTSLLNIINPGQILKNVPSDIQVMRYHSIIANLDQKIPECFRLTAYTQSPPESIQANGRELMAIEHKEYPIYGVQFHPESFATEFGSRIIQNFLEVC